MEYCVYMHTCPKGRVYIGITRNNPLKRWQNGTGYRTNEYFTRAIKKYGWENFKHEILFTGLSEKEAQEKEIQEREVRKKPEENCQNHQSVLGLIQSMWNI